MRGAAMSFTAAASGLVGFLLSVSAVQGQDGWGVTYSSTEICAVKGSTVEISCSYTYPSTWDGGVHTVEKTFWSTKQKGGGPVDLRTVSEYAGRVEDLCENDICTLRMKNLRESDSAMYRFRFQLNQPDGKYIGLPGVRLSVTDAPKPPSVSVSPSAEIEEGSSVTLTCSSDANPAANYTWYKEDEDSPKASGQIFNITDFRAELSGSYSCGAQNKLGRSYSTLTLSVGTESSTMIVNILRTTLGVLMLIPVFLLVLWTRKKRALSSTTEAREPEEMELDSISEYENDSHTAAQTEDTEEQEDMMLT
ncbi:B-cell receptor CD22-like [Gymnodraco acuticeps]|uniref:B-cell receptor CD22-like n=1 Tax=Gymnodraco acuticeps TaxID=8218 RepID=A0A6P8U4M9_GYMAC|nr:B-cell receptor CD22-like [Gymnodraco acuticeps]